MRNKTRKLVSVLLAMCMMVLATVTGAFAAEPASAKAAARLTVKTADVAGLDWNAYVTKFTDKLDGAVTGDVAADVGRLLENAGVYNLLIVGVDSRLNDYEGRSDAMMVLTVNNRAKKVVLTSLLRDSYVSIPGYGKDRLNAAYEYGGISLLKKTIKENYGISIDAYATVNFNDVIEFVDDIGGIEMNVSSAEIKYINTYTASQNKELYGRTTNPDKITASAGTLRLNGMQALAYARIRYIGTDFGRTERQRKVISASLKQLFSLPVTTQVSVMVKYMQRVKTDVTVPELLYLVLVYATLDQYETTSMALPADGTYTSKTIDGKSVLKVDLPANRALWRATVGLE